MNKKLFFASGIWGAMSGFMGYSFLDGPKGIIVWLLGTILVTILAWETN